MKKIISSITIILLSLNVFGQSNNNVKNTENMAMEQVYDFLKQSGTYYLATNDGDQPRVRPFGTVNIFEERLYIQTGRKKNVAKQMIANPKVEICAMLGDKWIRVEATMIEDDNIEAKQSMLDAYPSLQSMYSATDDNTMVLYLTNVTATIFSFSSEPQVIKF
ncbi:MAG: pyridoxamine 5'-phosphate oxidase family protein [Bacteroidales bacterium]|nr:pyridoxamine 5'-phosphate oxidase family protein [Bacteroidales bacterium]